MSNYHYSYRDRERGSNQWVFFIFIGLIIFFFLISSKFTKKKRKTNNKKIKKSKGKFPFSKWKIIIHAKSFIENGKILEREFIEFLLKHCDVYFLTTVASDEEEEELKKILMYFVEECGVKEYKLLFNETEEGKIAVARQIKCDLYVDGMNDKEEKRMRKSTTRKKKKKEFNFFTEIARFIPAIGIVRRDRVDPDDVEKYGRNTFIGSTLEQLLLKSEF